jgi:electron transport complex protein RnfE
MPLLALCPLLAASTSLAKGLGLGLATLVVLVAGRAIATTVGRRLAADVRLGVIALLLAAIALVVERCMAAWLPDLHAELGIFLPLTAACSILLVAADTVTAEPPADRSLADTFATGSGFLCVVLLLGATRDTLGDRVQLLLLPAGAFILLGLMLAARNAARAQAAESGSGEVRGSAS